MRTIHVGQSSIDKIGRPVKFNPAHHVQTLG